MELWRHLPSIRESKEIKVREGLRGGKGGEEMISSPSNGSEFFAKSTR